jgi:hypothetical protein
MGIYLESDTTKIVFFIIFFIIIMFIFAILNVSYKDTEKSPNTPEWGGQLLMIIFIISFAALIYQYNSLYLFIAIVVLIAILII